MNEIANQPLDGDVIQAADAYVLTIGEYEDYQVLGEYETEDEALIALGRYVLAHGCDGPFYPHITQI